MVCITLCGFVFQVEHNLFMPVFVFVCMCIHVCVCVFVCLYCYGVYYYLLILTDSNW